MITKTSKSAIGALIYLGRSSQTLHSPRQMAEALGESPTYLAKVLGHLVRAGILRATRGAKGGVQLNRPPSQISALSIVEACQGILVGNYCQTTCNPEEACAYHQAALELQQAIVSVLSKWTLARLMEHPRPRKAVLVHSGCVLLGIEQNPVKPKRRVG
jgi:Rrf2 family protein